MTVHIFNIKIFEKGEKPVSCESKLPQKSLKKEVAIQAKGLFTRTFFLHEQQCSMVTTSIKMAQFVLYTSGMCRDISKWLRLDVKTY